MRVGSRFAGIAALSLPNCMWQSTSITSYQEDSSSKDAYSENPLLSGLDSFQKAPQIVYAPATPQCVQMLPTPGHWTLMFPATGLFVARTVGTDVEVTSLSIRSSDVKTCGCCTDFEHISSAFSGSLQSLNYFLKFFSFWASML